MRLTEFHERVHAEFGPVFGQSVLRDHVLTAMGGVTASAAVARGSNLRDIWRAICEDFDVPCERW
ncbi:DUF3046 domain-containing protein [Hoyosella sp. YIM 151337]|uniref:DUF3046 domain-containing protein n=1 Tax=Hoyosella sp. YIM 151337 TaxID=2992742 RepID=UPI002235712F|nr:DUF3046 domain-containing protein [Hoyosella sp. YIM 151337]MCW4353829.1 DUF3046 domain-containing protein [Hoyosella sp. YIM 151337]